MKIKVVKGDREVYKDVLLIGTPNIEAINKYIDKGTLVGMFKNDKCIGVCHYSEMNDHEVEINNISLIPSMQKQGLGTRLLKYTFEKILNRGYSGIVVGSSNASIQNIAFYQKNGFDLQEVWLNYFIDNNYDKIFENGIQCKHMLRFKFIK